MVKLYKYILLSSVRYNMHKKQKQIFFAYLRNHVRKKIVSRGVLCYASKKYCRLRRRCFLKRVHGVSVKATGFQYAGLCGNGGYGNDSSAAQRLFLEMILR